MLYNTFFFISLTFLSTVYCANPCLDQPDGEVLPYEGNPVNYLICFNNDPILMVCEDGQEFDVEKNICKKKSSGLDTNHTNTDAEHEISESQKANFCRNLTDGILLPYSIKCNEFYVCINGSALLKRCPDNFYYNSREEHCVEEDTTECTSQIDNALCNGKPDGLMLPHTEECEKFFVCIFNEAVEKFCPKGLHFSPKHQVCTWPEEAGCELNNICKNQNNGEVFPDPDNCTNYFLCFKEEARPKICPHGLHFSPTKKHCMLPELAGCEKIDPEPEPEDPSFCKNITDGILLPYSTNCSEFYLCFNETALLKQCEKSLYYNSRVGFCVPPEESECEPEINDNICKDKPEGTRLSHPDDCGKFFVCTSDKASEKFCPTGLHFSPKNLTCTWPEEAGCEEDTNPCKNQINGEMFPDTKNCSSFIFCFNAEIRSKQCPIGLHFSAKSKYCMLPELAECEKVFEQTSTSTITSSSRKDTSSSQQGRTSTRNTPIPTAETEGPLISTRKTSAQTQLPPETTSNVSPTIKSSSTTSTYRNCAGKFGKNIKHPSDCTKYIVCVGGGMVMNCPSLLEFNEKLEVCDWPERADCKV